MGRPRSVGGGRPFTITVRLSAEEHERLLKACGGHSPSVFVRHVLFNVANVGRDR